MVSQYKTSRSYGTFLTLLRLGEPPTRPPHAHVGEEGRPHGGSKIDERNISPVDGIPLCKVPRQVYV